MSVDRAVRRKTHSDFEAGVVLGAKLLADVFDAVVAASTAVLLKPKSAEWESNVILNDKQVFLRCAFKKAQNENKLVFIYWGAEWCPPCNSLKNAVFNRPKFSSLMQGFVSVYLDGDTDAAQWHAPLLGLRGLT